MVVKAIPTTLITDSEAQLPFDKAIALFAKKMAIPAKDLAKLTEEMTDMAFFMSDVSNMTLLSDVYSLCEEAIANGSDFKDFLEKFEEVLGREGWTPKEGVARRAKAVYDTNLRTAYQGGKYQKMTEPGTMSRRPWAEWVHRDSRVPRPAHKALDGTIYRLEDLVSGKLLCPCGFGCRCTVITHKTPPRPPATLPKAMVTLTNKRTGKKFTSPVVEVEGKKYPIVEPGFKYNPGLMSKADEEEFKKDMKSAIAPPLRKLI